MSRYNKLTTWLAKQPTRPFQLTFAEIENVLEAPLPESARRHAPYWSTHNHVGRLIQVAGWIARPHFASGAVHFSPADRQLEPPKSVASATSTINLPVVAPEPDLILVGCVKQKQPGRRRAKDLYTSTLFRGRRALAERRGVPWFILSARYGLVSPDEEIDSYDTELKNLSASERSTWSEHVLDRLRGAFGSVSGKVIEIHAGAEYRNYGLSQGLQAQGATVSVPLAHMDRGKQIAWYQRQGGQTVAAQSARDADTVAHGADIAEVVRALTGAFVGGTLDFSDRVEVPQEIGWQALPEFVATKALRAGGASDAQVRAFLTFVAALDRAREANQLWNAAVNLYSAAPWVIDPGQVTSHSLTELRNLLAMYGVSRRHMSDSAAWRLIAEGLVDSRSPESVRDVLAHGKGDAATLLEDVRSQAHSNQSWYPFLSGPKVSAMWVRMLIAPGGAELARAEVIPVAVDVQVRRVSENLLVTRTQGVTLEEARPIIQAAWHFGAGAAAGPHGLAGTSAAIDPAIWFFGKWGCTHCQKVGKKRPVHAVCARCQLE